MYGKYGKSCQEMVAKNRRFPAKTGGLESLNLAGPERLNQDLKHCFTYVYL